MHPMRRLIDITESAAAEDRQHCSDLTDEQLTLLRMLRTQPENPDSIDMPAEDFDALVDCGYADISSEDHDTMMWEITTEGLRYLDDHPIPDDAEEPLSEEKMSDGEDSPIPRKRKVGAVDIDSAWFKQLFSKKNS